MGEKILYFECFSGISGDMTVAALLDLGADQQVLLNGLSSLKVAGYRVEIGRRQKSSIDACDFNVILEQGEEAPDYENEQLHSHDHVHPHSHDSEPAHDHSHGHGHVHRHNSNVNIVNMKVSTPPQLVLGHHEHRNLHDINQIIDGSDITDRAKTISKRIFEIIATAEAKAHARPVEEVHFHEVGAIDSIVDIVAAAICLDNLGVKNVVVSELYEGTGQIRCQHGLLPIPVPAVSNIAAMHQLPLHITNVKGELVTPTGAAIVAAIKTSDQLPKDMKILKIGLGAGKRNYPGATGLLRAMLLEDTSSSVSNELPTDKMWVLEANIDDCTGEALAFAMDLLFQNGAKDVYYTPIFMKKNRPAYLLGVICKEEDIPQLESIIFTHTTTIGIRKHEVIRTILPREQKTVVTPYGPAFVKVCTYREETFYYPEYESVKSLCQKSNLDYMTMYSLIQNLSKTTK
jgi:uncharacterized protein (TIGR00299 family) protein